MTTRRIRLSSTVVAALALALAGLLALAQTTRAGPATTFTVDTPVDESDDNLADNACHTVSNHCSLRAAVQQADQLSGVIIALPAGTYILTDTLNGDLNLNADMRIAGAGAATTIVQVRRPTGTGDDDFDTALRRLLSKIRAPVG